MGKFLAGPGPWVRARRRHRVTIRFWKMVGEASARGPKVASEGGGKASPSRGGWPPGVFEGEREECLWSRQPAGRGDWAGTLDNTRSVPQLAVTFAKALDDAPCRSQVHPSRWRWKHMKRLRRGERSQDVL